MSNLSVRRLARHLQADRVSGTVVEVRLTWPPTISLRRLLSEVPFGGIVLSGGGTRTDFQVGALRCILQRGFDLWMVCGAPGGSPNAAKIAECLIPRPRRSASHATGQASGRSAGALPTATWTSRARSFKGSRSVRGCSFPQRQRAPE